MSKKPTSEQLAAEVKKLLDDLKFDRPLITSTLSEIHTKCGNPHCRCATGRRHVAHILTRNDKGKTKTTYVPVGLVPEVKEWVREYHSLRKRLNEITEVCEKIIRQYVKEKRKRTYSRRKLK